MINNIKFKEFDHTVSAKIFYMSFLSFSIFFFSIFAWLAYLVYLSCSMMSYHTGVHPLLSGIIAAFLLTSVTVSHGKVEKSVLPKFFRTILGAIVSLATIHYIYTVENWKVFEIALLLSPSIFVRLYFLFKKIKRI